MAENELRRHKIRAELYENLLTEDPNDFAAKVAADSPLSSQIPVNKPSELMVVIPALAAGSYKLELVTQYGGNSKQLLKEPRKSVFDRVLSVL